MEAVLTYLAVNLGVGLGVAMAVGTTVGLVGFVIALLLGPETKGHVFELDVVVIRAWVRDRRARRDFMRRMPWRPASPRPAPPGAERALRHGAPPDARTARYPRFPGHGVGPLTAMALLGGLPGGTSPTRRAGLHRCPT